MEKITSTTLFLHSSFTIVEIIIPNPFLLTNVCGRIRMKRNFILGSHPSSLATEVPDNCANHCNIALSFKNHLYAETDRREMLTMKTYFTHLLPLKITKNTGKKDESQTEPSLNSLFRLLQSRIKGIIPHKRCLKRSLRGHFLIGMCI